MAAEASGLRSKASAAAVDRHRQVALLEEPHQAPEADPAAVLEQAFAGEVAALDRLAHAVGIGEADVGVVLAVLHRGLGAFLVVHDEVDGEPRAVRPFGVGRVGAVADEIAAHLVGHRGSPDQGMRMVKGSTGTNSSSPLVPVRHMKTAKRPGLSSTVRP